MKIFFLKYFIRFLDTINSYGVLARFCCLFVKFIRSDGTLVPINKKLLTDKPTILVLDYERFRGDIELFVKTGKVYCFSLSPALLQILFKSWFSNNVLENASNENSLGVRWDFFAAKEGTELYEYRKKYQVFLRKLIPKLLDLLKIDIVMNSDDRYRREADFTRIASDLKYPHICYYREAMYIVPAHFKNAVYRHKCFGPFMGDIVAVQNEITKQTFIDSGSVQHDKIYIRGCPRMDEYIKKLNNSNSIENIKQKKQVAFFTFPKGAQLEDLTNFDFFNIAASVMRVIAKLAKTDREVNYVIRLKDLHFKGKNKGQIGTFKDIIKKEWGDEEPKNIEFSTDKMAAQKIIMESDVIIAMQSTSVLEAAITGKPVILPHYNELMEMDRVKEILMYYEYHEIFDVPNNEQQLESMVIKRLNDPVVEPNIVLERKRIFEQYVSPLQANSVQTCIELFEKIKINKISTTFEKQLA